MERIPLYTRDLFIDFIEDKEQVFLSSINLQKNKIKDKIDINNLTPIGTFYIDLLNNVKEIYNFLDELHSKIEQDNHIYSSILTEEILKKYYKKNNPFFVFYINIINRKIKENNEKYENSLKILEELKQNLAKLKTNISSQENLENTWKIEHEKFNSLYEMLKEFNSKETINNLKNHLVSSSIEDLEKKLNREIDELEFRIELEENTVFNFSPEEVSKKICKIIKADKLYLDSNITSIEYYFNITKHSMTKNEFNFINKQIIIPEGQKLFCFKEKNYIYTFENLYLMIGKDSNKKISEQLLKKINDIKKPIVLNNYFIDSLKKLLDFYLNYFLEHDLNICKCENCGKYFLPNSRSDEKYCNAEYKNGLSCKDYAPKMKYRKGINDDEIKKLNYNLSTRYHMKIKRTHNYNIKKEIENTFSIYKEEYQKNKLLNKKEELSDKDFLTWIKNQITEYDNKYSRNKSKNK